MDIDALVSKTEPLNRIHSLRYGAYQQYLDAVSVFANKAGESEWTKLREIQGLLAFMRSADLKRVSVAVGQDEESGVFDERAVVQAYADEVRDSVLEIYVPRAVVVEEEQRRTKKDRSGL
ncbi:hypothetical protein BLS_004811 [Venturia inaequalis]|uniref:Uncharacterized protein n=1 Tax=Venturia inaequalis TaxID=5025 RepID=A0A8H3UZU5_VENIN|nr:hypothetical protein BLS_004811 [Venturia inaequalis]KAE9979400.1 hypothetical protein EG328_000885 [Venturia inaequalis]